MDWIIKPDEEEEESYVAACQFGMTGSSCSGGCCGKFYSFNATPDNLELW